MGGYDDVALASLRDIEQPLFDSFIARYDAHDGPAPATDSALLDAVASIVEEQIPYTEPNTDVQPVPFSWGEGHGAGWAVFLALGGVVTLLSGGPSALQGVWLFVAAGLALVVHVIWALAANGSEADRLATARGWAEAAALRVHEARYSLGHELHGAMLHDLALYIANRIGIPERLRRAFAVEFIAQKDDPLYAWSERANEFRNAPEYPPAPGALRQRLTHEEYEAYCCKVLHSLGFTTAKVSRYSRDGGIDIESDECVAQCKHYQGSVGASAIRELYGVASHRQKRPFFFTSGDYTRDAIKDASAFGVALFVLDELDGKLVSVNRPAEKVCDGQQRA